MQGVFKAVGGVGDRRPVTPETCGMSLETLVIEAMFEQLPISASVTSESCEPNRTEFRVVYSGGCHEKVLSRRIFITLLRQFHALRGKALLFMKYISSYK